MHDENCGFRLSGGTRPCFFPVPALLFPCYLAPVFARKAFQIRALPEKAGEKTPNIRRNLPFPPSALRPKTAEFRGLSARFAANPLHLQQNGHRPPANRRARPSRNRDRGAFSPAANPLQMQPDAHRIAARSGGRMPTSGMRCRGAVIPMSGVISSAVGIRRPARCIG
jgi:hypothetical protein